MTDTAASSADRVTDVLIVGSGIMGAIIAKRIRDENPSVSILMVDPGRAIGERPGQHLHDSTDDAVRARYLTKVSTGVQGLYTGATATPAIETSVAEIEPGM